MGTAAGVQLKEEATEGPLRNCSSQRESAEACEDMGAGPSAADNGEKVEELVASFGEVRTVKSR